MEPPEVDLEFDTWLGVLNSISWGSKSQKINAINIKNVQDMVHVPSP